MLTIYHNPKCSKSRDALSLINDRNIEVKVIEYLKNIPTESELLDLLKKLAVQPSEIVRKGEAIFKEKFKGKTLTDQEWVKAMVEYPKLIERPIIVKGNKAVIGRPTENVLHLID